MLLRLTELRVPSWSAKTPLHAPLRPASGGRPGHGKTPPFLPEDWPASAASTEPFIHAISQPRPLQGVVRVRARASRVRGGAWGVGRWRRPCVIGTRAPSWSSRVLGVSPMLPAACCPRFCVGLRVLWPRCVPSVSSCTLRCLCASVLAVVAAWRARPPLNGSARVVSVPKAR